MTDQEELVAAVLCAADGEITGRIRLQKIFYLLEQKGLGGDFWYSYHHYGPYSEDLSTAIDYAVKLDKTVMEEQTPIEGGFFSTYRLAKTPGQAPSHVGALPWEQARDAIRDMKAETSVVIELAATIHWLAAREKIADWQRELRIRKPSKADDARTKKATILLGKLGLGVEASAAA